MVPIGVRRWFRRRVSCSAVIAAGLLLLLATWLLPKAPQPLLTTARFPHVAPKKLAHLLADFSTHLLLYPHLGEWSLEDESNNYTAWRYSVKYSCGEHCSGRADVLALDEHSEKHERGGRGEAGSTPRAHTVRVTHRSCSPMLPVVTWPLTCEEWETVTYIVSDGSDGALMQETARASCGAGRGGALPVYCGEGGLRAARERHLLRLRAILNDSLA